MKIFITLIRYLLATLGYDLRKTDHTQMSSAAEMKLPVLPMARIVTGDCRVSFIEPDQVNGNVSVAELLIINALIVKKPAEAIFEIGTFDGRTTVNMAANSCPHGKVYTLDLPETAINAAQLPLDDWDRQYVHKSASGVRFHGTQWELQIVQLLGDSATFDYTPYEGKMDLVFIDGSHSYDYVKSDTQKALKLAASSAYILWHDYQPFWSGVVQYLNELYDQGGLFAQLRKIQGTSLVILPVGRIL
jgi:predicted O-methyltransferase YrrM